MDYQKELGRLKEQEAQGFGEYWKPEPGQHKLKLLGELEDADPYEEEGKEPQLRKQIEISENGKESTWSMPFGRTPQSTYGQLVSLGSVKGKLTGTELTVVVIGTGQSKRFTIVA